MWQWKVETGAWRQATEDWRQDSGDKIWEIGFGRLEMERVLWRQISKQLSAYNLVGEFDKFLRTLIANCKYKLAVATKSAKRG